MILQRASNDYLQPVKYLLQELTEFEDGEGWRDEETFESEDAAEAYLKHLDETGDYRIVMVLGYYSIQPSQQYVLHKMRVVSGE